MGARNSGVCVAIQATSTSATCTCRQQGAYVSIRQHTSAYVSIRQHLRHGRVVCKEVAYDVDHCAFHLKVLRARCQHKRLDAATTYVSIRQHTSAQTP